MPIRLVMLDCDGVLFHSERANIEFYNAILRAMGEPALTPELERFCTYASARQLLQACFPADPARYERALAVSHALSYEPFYAHMIPFDGLFETLAELGRSVSLAMATNRSRTAVELLGRFGLDRHISFVSALGPGVRPKPEPDLLVRCLEHFGIAASEALYVGDADTDRIAAERAGTAFLAMGDRVPGAPSVTRFPDLLEVVASYSSEVSTGGPSTVSRRSR